MKKIVLDYYSQGNFGDDLFILIFIEHFKKEGYKVTLLGNPVVGRPAEVVKAEVNYSIASYSACFFSFLYSKVKNKVLKNLLHKAYYVNLHMAQSFADDYVKIGGSIFMDRREGEEIKFSLDRNVPRSFDIVSTPKDNNGSFIIGANLGPVYHEEYWERVQRQFINYNHVALRDYASYSKVMSLTNVQYAPDIGFLSEKLVVKSDTKKLLVSVLEIEKHTNNVETIEQYYRLLSDACVYWGKNEGSVILLSLCEKEGDMRAVKKIYSLINKSVSSEMVSYRGNITKIKELFASSEYIICTRFHSMIMGLVHDKRIFPISYNCKMEHYLQDLHYEGKYATLDNFCNIGMEDLFENYYKNIWCDCKDHKKYAINQFYGLSSFLRNKGAIE